jgi:hypothetical protein
MVTPAMGMPPETSGRADGMAWVTRGPADVVTAGTLPVGQPVGCGVVGWACAWGTCCG